MHYCFNRGNTVISLSKEGKHEELREMLDTGVNSNRKDLVRRSAFASGSLVPLYYSLHWYHLGMDAIFGD